MHAENLFLSDFLTHKQLPTGGFLLFFQTPDQTSRSKSWTFSGSQEVFLSLALSCQWQTDSINLAHASESASREEKTWSLAATPGRGPATIGAKKRGGPWALTPGGAIKATATEQHTKLP